MPYHEHTIEYVDNDKEKKSLPMEKARKGLRYPMAGIDPAN